MKKTDIKIPKDTLEAIIESYTRESGVRELEKKIGKVLRKQHASMLLMVILQKRKLNRPIYMIFLERLNIHVINTREMIMQVL